MNLARTGVVFASEAGHALFEVDVASAVTHAELQRATMVLDGSMRDIRLRDVQAAAPRQFVATLPNASSEFRFRMETFDPVALACCLRCAAWLSPGASSSVV